MGRIESAIVAESKASHSQEFGIAGIRHSQELSVTTSTARNDERSERPLHGILVLDFSQFLSGSLATLRLADMGARSIYLSDTDIHGENTLFHAINRNKESYAADLKDPDDLSRLRRLIGQADVMVQNFRPGVMERLGLDYEHGAQANPRGVYVAVTG